MVLPMAAGVVFIAPLLPVCKTGAFPDTATIKSSLAEDSPWGSKNILTNSQGEIGKPEVSNYKIEG